MIAHQPPTETLKWNVIDESVFRRRVRDVFQQVANTLTNTLGPYGANTIIEKFGEMAVTKDGWQILKKISFDDPVEQNILQLLVNISAQVVIKVGDGSTSSIVSANAILKELENSDDLKKLRSKELITSLHNTVEKITERIVQSSVKIDAEADPELNDIYRLAMISTNGDEDVSEIIQTIYKQTGNPSIEFDKSKSAHTTYEIVEGYKSLITYLDAIYQDNEDGTCTVNDPMILMFDHRLDLDAHYSKILYPAKQQAMMNGRRLVVIAPHYDKFLLDHIRRDVVSEKQGTGQITSVYTRVSMPNNILQEQFNDLAILTGGTIIRESDIELFHHEEEPATIDQYLGRVGRLIIGPETTLAQGFDYRNEDMYELALRDAKAKFSKLEETHRELNIVDSKLYEVKKRLSKLSCVMGIIHVGGGSGLEKSSNYDLVEDAVKACESAYNYGYNIGGNLIIPITIGKMLQEDELTETERTILILLNDAFLNVFVKVLSNKFTDEPVDTLLAIAKSSVQEEQCFNLLTDSFSKDVINPSFTDIEILRAATSIVSLLLGSNQYISIALNTNVEN